MIQFVDGSRPYDSPPAYSVSMVSPTPVAEFAVEAEVADLINDRTDFGTPGVPDLPFTTVRLHVRILELDASYGQDADAPRWSGAIRTAS